MRIMGIDYGSKRIGVAVSDPGRTMAHPLQTIQVHSDGSHFRHLEAISRTYEVERVVVGLPYNMDGSLGFKAEEVLAWAKDLEEALGLPVTFWDERLSTHEAHDLLMGLQVKGKKRKAVVDKIAAGIILQAYLDAGHP
jgi:putative Holliday junction resolvase